MKHEDVGVLRCMLFVGYIGIVEGYEFFLEGNTRLGSSPGRR